MNISLPIFFFLTNVFLTMHGMTDKPFIPKPYQESFFDNKGNVIRSGTPCDNDENHYNFWKKKFEDNQNNIVWQEKTDKNFSFHLISGKTTSIKPTLIFFKDEKPGDSSSITVQDYSFFRPFLALGFTIIAPVKSNAQSPYRILEILKNIPSVDHENIFMCASKKRVAHAIHALIKAKQKICGMILDTPLGNIAAYATLKAKKNHRFLALCKTIATQKAKDKKTKEFENMAKIQKELLKKIIDKITLKYSSIDPISNIASLVSLCPGFYIMHNEKKITMRPQTFDLGTNLLKKDTIVHHAHYTPAFECHPFTSSTNQKTTKSAEIAANYLYKLTNTRNRKPTILPILEPPFESYIPGKQLPMISFKNISASTCMITSPKDFDPPYFQPESPISPLSHKKFKKAYEEFKKSRSNLSWQTKKYTFYSDDKEPKCLGSCTLLRIMKIENTAKNPAIINIRGILDGKPEDIIADRKLRRLAENGFIVYVLLTTYKDNFYTERNKLMCALAAMNKEQLVAPGKIGILAEKGGSNTVWSMLKKMEFPSTIIGALALWQPYYNRPLLNESKALQKYLFAHSSPKRLDDLLKRISPRYWSYYPPKIKEIPHFALSSKAKEYDAKMQGKALITELIHETFKGTFTYTTNSKCYISDAADKLPTKKMTHLEMLTAFLRLHLA